MAKLTVDVEKQAACSHSCGFTLVAEVVVENGEYPAAWQCNKGCGFFLNFNPNKFPDGVAFLPGPGSMFTKSLPELVKSERG